MKSTMLLLIIAACSRRPSRSRNPGFCRFPRSAIPPGLLNAAPTFLSSGMVGSEVRRKTDQARGQACAILVCPIGF